MILQCNYANEGCGLPRGDGTIRKKRGESAELIAGKSSLSKRLFRGKGKMTIFRMRTHNENDNIMTSSTRRRRGLWNHRNRSYG